MIVTGSSSMISSRFLELCGNQFANLLPLDFPEFDLIKTTEAEIIGKFSSHEQDVLVHFAAFTDVDGAESQRGDKNGACWQLNVEGTRKLALVAKRLNLKMVYISTDFVFDGSAGPYTEVDLVAKSADSISWYGWTKLVGEKIVQESGFPFLIARTSYPYRANFANKLDFVRNIIEGLKNDTLYPVFSDQFLTPTFIDNFAKALYFLAKENQTGIWHVVDNTTLTAYEAAYEIAKVFGFNGTKIDKISIIEFQKQNPKAAVRPIMGGLKNDKLVKFLQSFDFSMQDFGEALVEMKKQRLGLHLGGVRRKV